MKRLATEALAVTFIALAAAPWLWCFCVAPMLWFFFGINYFPPGLQGENGAGAIFPMFISGALWTAVTGFVGIAISESAA